MPQPHSYINDRYIIKVSCYPLWRRILGFYPYFVGQKVLFKIEIKSRARDWSPNWFDMKETFGNTERYYERIKLDNNVFVGDVISNEGDILYKLKIMGPKGFLGRDFTVFTARAVNTDRWALGCLGFLVGIVATVIAGIILGFIQIVPFWKIWIP